MSKPHRFTASHPCPICSGHDGLARGQSVRCFGYLDRTGDYARCTREEMAGKLPQNRDGTYSHRLQGCRCGLEHGAGPDPVGVTRPAAADFRPSRAEPRFRSYFTLEAALRQRYGDGTGLRHWTYRDAEGHEAFRVVRIDYRAPDGSRAKSYRPSHRGSDGRWRLSLPDGLLPLYDLPAILAAPPEATITVLEGEKCAEIAAGLGLPHVTTSAHGAKAPWLTDWSPLAGRPVALLRDEGRDGEAYAGKVAERLAALHPPARVRIVSLPNLSDGDDIEQFAAARRSAGRTDAEILAELYDLIAQPAACEKITSHYQMVDYMYPGAEARCPPRQHSGGDPMAKSRKAQATQDIAEPAADTAPASTPAESAPGETDGKHVSRLATEPPPAAGEERRPWPDVMEQKTVAVAVNGEKLRLLQSRRFNQMQITSDSEIPDWAKKRLKDDGWVDRVQDEGIYTKQLPPRAKPGEESPELSSSRRRASFEADRFFEQLANDIRAERRMPPIRLNTAAVAER
jgi:hypothetical protein